MIRLKPMMLTANGQMPMPARRPAWAGSRLNSFSQVPIRNIRAMKPKAVVTRAMKQPQNSTWSWRLEPAAAVGCGGRTEYDVSTELIADWLPVRHGPGARNGDGVE